jgi:hypothetical protein
MSFLLLRCQFSIRTAFHSSHETLSINGRVRSHRPETIN